MNAATKGQLFQLQEGTRVILVQVAVSLFFFIFYPKSVTLIWIILLYTQNHMRSSNMIISILITNVPKYSTQRETAETRR
jgi:hypothetical protein